MANRSWRNRLNQNQEHIKNEITQSVLMLHQELVSQKNVVQRFRNLRQFFIQHGFSPSLSDAMIADWDAKAQQTQHYIEYGVLEWFATLRDDCLQKNLPTTDVDFAITEWEEQLQHIKQNL